jgi:hypothetical protein
MIVTRCNRAQQDYNSHNPVVAVIESSRSVSVIARLGRDYNSGRIFRGHIGLIVDLLESADDIAT